LADLPALSAPLATGVDGGISISKSISNSSGDSGGNSGAISTSVSDRTRGTAADSICHGWWQGEHP